VSSNKNKTFKPLKSHGAASTKRHKLSEYAKATLGSGNMRAAVMLPKGEDLNEWLAVNSQQQQQQPRSTSLSCACLC
jgi:MOB kinase activator 1